MKSWICSVAASVLLLLSAVRAAAASGYGERIQLYVKFLSGETVTFDVISSDIVESLREKIQERVEGGFRIVFAGKKLEDGRTFNDYNIKNGSTVHAVVRLRHPEPEKKKNSQVILVCGKERWSDWVSVECLETVANEVAREFGGMEVQTVWSVEEMREVVAKERVFAVLLPRMKLFDWIPEAERAAEAGGAKQRIKSYYIFTRLDTIHARRDMLLRSLGRELGERISMKTCPEDIQQEMRQVYLQSTEDLRRRREQRIAEIFEKERQNPGGVVEGIQKAQLGENGVNQIRIPALLADVLAKVDLPRGLIHGSGDEGASQMGGESRKRSAEEMENQDEEGCTKDRPMCMICLSDLFGAGRAVTILPCRHAFHQDEILNWGRVNRTCPLCKSGFIHKPAAEDSEDELYPSIEC